MNKTKRRSLLFISLCITLLIVVSCFVVSIGKKGYAEGTSTIVAYEGFDKSSYVLTPASVSTLLGYPNSDESDPSGWGITPSYQEFNTAKYEWGLSLSLTANKYLFCTQTLSFANSYDASLITKLTIEGYIESDRSVTGTGAGADFGAYYFVKPGETNATNDNSIKITGAIQTNLGCKFSIDFTQEEFNKIAVDGKIIGLQVVGVDAVGTFIGNYGFLDLVAVYLETETTCTVTFDSNGGSSVPSQTVYYYSKLADVPTPTKTDSVFAGWVDKDGNAVDISEPILNDRTYYATWKEPLTVTFNTDGGSIVDTQIIPYGSKAVSPEDPVKNGFIFAGWYLDENKFNFDTAISINMTLNAKWLKSDVGLITDFNNGNGFIASTAKSYKINGYPTNGAASPENWGVIGNAPTDGSKPAKTNISLTSLDNKTCVVFDLKSNQYNFFSEAIEIKNKLDITKISKLLIKLKITSDLSSFGSFNDEYTNIFLSGLTTENVSTSNSIVIGKDFRFNIWQTVEISDADLAKIANNGYFEGLQVSCLDIQKKNVGDSAKLYIDAIYIQSNDTCAIDYDSNGGTEVQDQTVVYGSLATIPTEPTKQDVFFVSWYYGETSEKVDFDKPVTVSMTYKARWAVKKTVTFDSAGGSEVSPQIILEGELATKPDDPTYGYNIFLGWYNGSTLFDFNTPISSDLNLVAKWETRYGGIVLDFNSKSEYTEITRNLTRIDGSNGADGASWGAFGWETYGPYNSPYEITEYKGKSCLSFYVLFHSVILPDKGIKFKAPIDYDQIDSVIFNVYVDSSLPESNAAWNEGVSYTSVGTGFHIYKLSDNGDNLNTGIRFSKGFTYNTWQTVELTKSNGLERLKDSDGYINGFQLASFDIFGMDTSDAHIYIDSVIVTTKSAFTVTFDVNGGSNVENQTVPYGCLLDSKACFTERNGYTFIGWLDEGGNHFDISDPIIENTNLTAVWQENVGPDLPDEEYVYNPNSPIVLEMDSANCKFTNQQYLEYIDGNLIIDNYPVTGDSNVTGNFDSVRLSNKGSVYSFKIKGSQVTQSFALRFAYKINLKTLSAHVSGLYLRVMYKDNSLSASTTSLYLYGYSATGEFDSQGYKVDLVGLENGKWTNLKLSLTDLAKLADANDYIGGLQIVAVRRDTNSLEDYFYFDYFAHTILEPEVSTIVDDSAECSDFDAIGKNYLILADGKDYGTTDGVGTLEYIIDYTRQIDKNNWGVMLPIESKRAIEIVDLPTSINGKAYKFAINNLGRQGTSNAIKYSSSLDVNNVESITLRIMCHFNTEDVWSSNILYFFPLGNKGWFETGYCITDIEQDVWVDITISGRQLERFAGTDGKIEGLQIGMGGHSIIGDKYFYVPDDMGNPRAFIYVDSVYAVAKYNVIFDEDNGTVNEREVGSTELQDYYYIPKKAGKVFAGWYLYEDGVGIGEEQFNLAITLTGDIRLKARWVDEENIATYQGLYISSHGNRIMIFGDKSVDLSDMMEGYLICGISDNILYVYNNYKIKQFNLSTVFIKENNFSTVMWDDGLNLTVELVKTGNTVTEKYVTRKGFTFVKWTDGNKQDVFFPITVNEDMILCAVWTTEDSGNNDKAIGEYFNAETNDYILLKVANGLTNTYIAEVYTSQYVFKGNFNILDDNTIIFSYDGGFFTGVFYDDYRIKIDGENIFLQLTEKIPTIVCFETNNATRVRNADTDNGYIVKPVDPTKIGYKFSFWARENGEEFDFSEKVTEFTVLYSVWDIDPNYDFTKYSALFDSNGGSTVDYKQVNSEGIITAPENPTKEGYNFAGWYYNGKVYDFGTVLSKDIKLEAVWEDIYYVIFDSNGGSDVDPIMVVNKRITLPDDPRRSGYTFLGWFYSNGTQFNENVDINNTIELTAKWEKKVEPIPEPEKQDCNNTFSVMVYMFIGLGAIVVIYVIARVAYRVVKGGKKNK